MGSPELNVHLKPQQNSLVSNTGLETSRAFLSFQQKGTRRAPSGRGARGPWAWLRAAGFYLSPDCGCVSGFWFVREAQVRGSGKPFVGVAMAVRRRLQPRGALTQPALWGCPSQMSRRAACRLRLTPITGCAARCLLGGSLPKAKFSNSHDSTQGVSHRAICRGPPPKLSSRCLETPSCKLGPAAARARPRPLGPGAAPAEARGGLVGLRASPRDFRKARRPPVRKRHRKRSRGPRSQQGRGLGSHVGGARRVGAGGDPARSASGEGGGLAEGTAASAAAPASPRSQAAPVPPVSPVPSELQPSGELGESRHQASPCAGRWRGTAGAPAAAVSLSHSLCRVSGQSLWGILFPALRQEPGSPGWAREPLRRDSHS